MAGTAINRRIRALPIGRLRDADRDALDQLRFVGIEMSLVINALITADERRGSGLGDGAVTHGEPHDEPKIRPRDVMDC
jgi:hypothetical protein